MPAPSSSHFKNVFTMTKPQGTRHVTGSRGFGSQSKPGVSYPCTKGNHGACTKLACTCACGHGGK